MTAYTELQDDVPQFLYTRVRADGSWDQILINAHEEVVKRLDHEAFRASVSQVMVSAEGLIAWADLPARLMEIRSVAVKSAPEIRYRGPLRQGDITTLEMLYEEEPYGKPRNYAQTDEGLVIFPAPGSNAAIEARIRYNEEPEPITLANQDNLITDNHRHLFRAMVSKHMAIWLKDQPLMDLYSQEADSVLDRENAQIGRRKRDEARQRLVETTNVVGN